MAPKPLSQATSDPFSRVVVALTCACLGWIFWPGSRESAADTASKAAEARQAVVDDVVIVDREGQRWKVDLSELDGYIRSRSGYQIAPGQWIKVGRGGTDTEVVSAAEAQQRISSFQYDTVGGNPAKVARERAERERAAREAQAKEEAEAQARRDRELREQQAAWRKALGQNAVPAQTVVAPAPAPDIDEAIKREMYRDPLPGAQPDLAEWMNQQNGVGRDVHVQGYHRKDGTYVQPHTRSAPGHGRGH
jgi:hypothetical protein